MPGVGDQRQAIRHDPAPGFDGQDQDRQGKGQAQFALGLGEMAVPVIVIVIMIMVVIVIMRVRVVGCDGQDNRARISLHSSNYNNLPGERKAAKLRCALRLQAG
jgi:hypothetical protein